MTTHDGIKVKKANRRSAVERLEESKANYVKTERVLDSKQEFEHSSTLHVSTGPPIDVLLRGPVKNIYNNQSIIYQNHNLNQPENFICDPLIMKRSTPQPLKSFDSKSKVPKKENEFLNKVNYTRNPCFPDAAHEVNVDVTQRWAKPTSNAKDIRASPKRLVVGSRSLGNDYTHHTDYTHHSGRHSTIPTEKSFIAYEAERCSIGSDREEQLTDDTRDSASVGDVMEFDDKCHGSKTSDYVSRSSSFKSPYPIDRVRNLVSRFETQGKKDPLTSNTERKVRAVSRSKSDVGHRFSHSFGFITERRMISDTELERFFSCMGLDTVSLKNLTSPASPAKFFDSISSVNSNDHISSIGSEESLAPQKEGLRNRDLQLHAPADTSIVEKNARVVKWLYSCHNAKRVSSP